MAMIERTTFPSLCRVLGDSAVERSTRPDFPCALCRPHGATLRQREREHGIGIACVLVMLVMAGALGTLPRPWDSYCISYGQGCVGARRRGRDAARAVRRPRAHTVVIKSET